MSMINKEKPETWWNRGDFDFIRIPKDLFRQAATRGLSLEAKMLYGLLLDRTSLSAKNGREWIDAKGEVFVYYSMEEAARMLGCGLSKASKSMRELEKLGLLTRLRHGCGKPYQIVVRPFAAIPEKGDTGTGQGCTPVQDNGPNPWEAVDNKTESNQTENTQTESASLEAEDLESEVKEQISYISLQETYKPEDVELVLSVLLQTLQTKRERLNVLGRELAAAAVRRKLEGLEMIDVSYVLDRLEGEKQRIHNLSAWVLARLWEAPEMKNRYYSSWVASDLEKERSRMAGQLL